MQPINTTHTPDDRQ